ncbi:hypothetical protein D9M71_450490 [compost metagenome]
MSFLNRHYALRLDARLDRGWLAKAASHVAEAKLASLYVTTSGELTKDEWIRAAMAYFHRIKLPSRELLQYEEQAEGDQRGVIVKFEGQAYWVPERRAPHSA